MEKKTFPQDLGPLVQRTLAEQMADRDDDRKRIAALSPGGRRLTDEQARVKYIRTRAGATALREHDEIVSREALKFTQRATGKLAPVYPSVQTVGTSRPFKKRAGSSSIEVLIMFVFFSSIGLLGSLFLLFCRYLYLSV